MLRQKRKDRPTGLTWVTEQVINYEILYKNAYDLQLRNLLRSADPIELRSLATRMQRNELNSNAKSRWSHIGSGQHARAFQFSSADMRLVIKFHEETEERDARSLKAWLARIERLKQARLILVPPMLHFWLDERVVIEAMPFGNENPSGALNFRLPGLVDTFERRLEAINLNLNDHPQIRWMNDLPYIIDFSTLRDTEASGSLLFAR